MSEIVNTTSAPLTPAQPAPVLRRAGIGWLLRELAGKRSAQIGGSVVLLLLIGALFGPWIVPYDPFHVDAINRLQPPGWQHFFGTDELGRDIFSRIVYGSRYFVLISITAAAIAISVGVPMGLLAGAGPFWLDNIIMRIVDVLLAYPYILLVLAVVAILGPSLTTAMVAVGVAGVPGYARLVRGEVLSVRQTEYVEAMQALGASHGRVVFRTILPNVTSSIIIYASYATPLAVLSAAALSFLGLGAQPPMPEWGAMLVNARTFMRTAWWTVAAPGVAIFVSILAINLLGNALRDVLDPRTSGK